MTNDNCISILIIFKPVIIFFKIILILLSLIFQNKINHKVSQLDILTQKREIFSQINEFNKIYSELYFTFRNRNSTIEIHNSTKNFNNYSNKVLLCATGKNENLYAKEFVDFYYSLGFDKIIIFDNNDLNGEKFDDVLRNYISQNIVEIIDIRGLKSIQVPVYNYCYRKYMNLYNWIAFFDFDEYLYLQKNLSIKDYLSNNAFKKCETILFNWRIFDDNNLLRYDNRTMIERFTSQKNTYNVTKFIARGNLKELLIPSMHIAINTNYCNSKGEFTYPISQQIIPIENNPFAYIRHYYTKTAEEYCNKVLRGDAQFGKSKPNVERIK